MQAEGPKGGRGRRQEGRELVTKRMRVVPDLTTFAQPGAKPGFPGNQHLPALGGAGGGAGNQSLSVGFRSMKQGGLGVTGPEDIGVTEAAAF